MIEKRNRWLFFQEHASYIVTIILLFSLSFSESVLSISSAALFFLIFITGHTRYKLNMLKQDKALLFLMSVYLVYLIGCFFCKDFNTGFYELKKNIFWILIPSGVALMPGMNNKKVGYFLLFFLLFVSAATLIATFKIVFSEYFRIVDVRDASYVSHVAFSLQIVFAVFVLGFSSILRIPIIGRINRWIVLIWITWLLLFLGFQKSLIGFLSLFGAGIFFFLWLISHSQQKRNKIRGWIALSFFIFLPIGYVGWVSYNYFHLREPEPDFNLTTSSGNRYAFDMDNGLIENGYYVYWYVCEKELEESWNARSPVKLYETDAVGYRVYDTLIRYMTSKGLKKDADGVSRLTSSDINNVLSGISNRIFADKKYTIYPRIYQTIWELDYYKRTGNPNNQSLSQRIEYIRAAWFIIKNHFWGIGTGNYRNEFDNAFNRIGSQLNAEFRFNVHNQYLNYIVKFGFPGFLLIFYFIFIAIYWKKQFKNPLLVSLLIIIGIANLGDTTLETHIGLPFFLLFFSFFLWHSPVQLFKEHSPVE